MSFKVNSKLVGAERLAVELKRISSLDIVRAMAATAEDVEEFIEDEVGRHSKTGKLFSSIGKTRTADGWLVGHDGQIAPHALFVHWGTRPHIIEPRVKKSLRWADAGYMGPLAPKGVGGKGKGRSGFIFAKRVHHPGYRGDPWLVRAAAQAPVIFERHVLRQLASQADPG